MALGNKHTWMTRITFSSLHLVSLPPSRCCEIDISLQIILESIVLRVPVHSLGHIILKFFTYNDWGVLSISATQV